MHLKLTVQPTRIRTCHNTHRRCDSTTKAYSGIYDHLRLVCSVALHCIALHCIALHCIALHCIALHCIALHCIALHCIALHCIALHRIASHRIASHRIASHRIASHRIASHRIASHRIASHRIASHRIASHRIALRNYDADQLNRSCSVSRSRKRGHGVTLAKKQCRLGNFSFSQRTVNEWNILS